MSPLSRPVSAKAIAVPVLPWSRAVLNNRNANNPCLEGGSGV